MKAIYLFFCLLFISSSALKAQPDRIEIQTWKDYELKGQVKEVVKNMSKTLEFTPEGYLAFEEGIYKTEEGEGTFYTYDKAGRLLKEEEGVVNHVKPVVIYTYNVQGVLTEMRIFKEGNCYATILYDRYGNEHKGSYEGGKIILYTNTYDAQKRIIKIKGVTSENFWNTHITYLPNGWSKYVTVYRNGHKQITEYDHKGRLRKSTAVESGKTTSESSSKYDENDNLIESLSSSMGNDTFTYNAQGECSSATYDFSKSKRKYVYTYPRHDAMGNWTERITDSDGELTTTTRTFSYYE